MLIKADYILCTIQVEGIETHLQSSLAMLRLISCGVFLGLVLIFLSTSIGYSNV